ncbi:hypothetical protein BZB76_6113 [Actinomadura pelletieri DSM 43383]|uniref:Uncharacterized protein n=1 Tax=Actinomadura pelletieri DSM 43383 TaxID=1120940 RepID=A0A495QBB6_9ACTN|nr:hypothetical protein [Actinomadura pelletieri]RKS68975.1 hypothetical protein BZB76_6113 [Actinomadura pelletieri DSM 43383]
MLVLIRHLPRDSALVRALHGEEADWGAVEHLLAAVVDHLAIGNWLFTSAHSDSEPPRPEPVPRPGEAREEETAANPSPQELAAFFGGL